MNKNIKKAISLFVSVMCSLYFIVLSVTVYKAGWLSDSPPPNDIAEAVMNRADTVEGIFIDCNGTEITSHREVGSPAFLNYPEMSYLIGYNSSRLNFSGLRLSYCKELFEGRKDNVGSDIHLTLNASIQSQLYELLENSVGSISVINANTGEIVALASRSSADVDYDVNWIDEVYEEKENTIFYSDYYDTIDNFYYDHSVFAQHPPGSTGKIITAVSLVENGREDMTYVDKGIELNGSIINYNNYAYGSIGLQDALNDSVNTYFAKAGLTLGKVNLQRSFSNFMIGENIPLDFTTLTSCYASNKNVSKYVLAANAFGQGELVMSPLHIAMCTAAIMNNGTMMKPYVVSRVENDDKTTYEGSPGVLNKVTDEDSANKVKALLQNTAEHYGFYDYFSKDVTIIAKTGTAEVSSANGLHIYYALGVEIDGVPYAICIDQVDAKDVSSSLFDQAVATIDILLNEM